MKLLHSLKFQFTIIFSVFIICIILIISAMGIRQMSRAVEETLAAQGVYTVERAASLIDGDAFEALVRSGDISDPFFEETRLKLFELRNASGSLYLYTMAPVRGSIWKFVIDGSAEPGDDDFSAFGDEEDTSGYDDAFRKTLSTGKSHFSRLTYHEGWGWLISVYAPIRNSAGNIVGIVGCDFDGTHLRDNIVSKQREQILVGGLFIVIGLVLLMLFLRMVFSRLQKINTILREISLGEGDLTKRINIEKNDEIGELSTYFNMTLDKIRNLVARIAGESADLNSVGDDLTENMQQTAGAVHQIVAHIQDIKQKAVNQLASVTKTHIAMEQVTVNIDKLGVNVEVQTASVSESSSAIEEMLANVQSVTQTLIRNAENVEDLIKVSDEGRKSLEKVTHDIKEIAKESEGLLEINAVMENIAGQTSLLSMNAAIEAAHAGEAGKGFAVVSGEIRKLADSSSEQSKTISNVLKKIKDAIDAISISTNTALEKINAIDERIRTVSDQETNIRNAMAEQGQGSQRILEAISKMNEQTQMVKQGSDEMLRGSKKIISESKNLEQAAEEIAGGMNEMTKSADEINTAINKVDEISKKTNTHIELLFDEVLKFKVD
ncbi:MAG: methyl-accepting chemotaxis protein [Spirochaetes bacterium]|nr:methyl-accepting chemotaxis protein [Spirochaetota bacterium]